MRITFWASISWDSSTAEAWSAKEEPGYDDMETETDSSFTDRVAEGAAVPYFVLEDEIPGPVE